jgi:hypothetical protein
MHPLKAFFEANQLTPRAFAVFEDISLDTVRGFMSGKSRRVPTNIQKAIIRYGVDVNELDEQYAQWLQWRAKTDVMELRRKKV